MNVIHSAILSAVQVSGGRMLADLGVCTLTGPQCGCAMKWWPCGNRGQWPCRKCLMQELVTDQRGMLRLIIYPSPSFRSCLVDEWLIGCFDSCSGVLSRWVQVIWRCLTFLQCGHPAQGVFAAGGRLCHMKSVTPMRLRIPQAITSRACIRSTWRRTPTETRRRRCRSSRSTCCRRCSCPPSGRTRVPQDPCLSNHGIVSFPSA